MAQVQDGGYRRPQNGRRNSHLMEPTSIEPNSSRSDRAHPHGSHANHWKHRGDSMH
jgi:hypothetical protein